jgi:16S rRNA (guanine527-N7)-methyltransferase
MVSAGSLRLTESDRGILAAGAAALGLELDRRMVADLVRFADVLDLWNAKMSLVSCASSRELVERHFLDSMALAPVLSEEGLIVDLGSGAGFPGLPLAIVRSQQKVSLVEIRRRRASFLREVRRTLGLENLDVLELRAETPPPDYANVATTVVSRAVWSDSALLEIAGRWLKPGGMICWMRSSPLIDPLGAKFLTRERTIRYRIGHDRERLIEVLRYERAV